MLIGEVVGRVWADRSIPDLAGRRMVLVRELGAGAACVAVDLVDAGAGARVLVATDEAARSAAGAPGVDAAVVALVAGMDEAPGLVGGGAEAPGLVGGGAEAPGLVGGGASGAAARA